MLETLSDMEWTQFVTAASKVIFKPVVTSTLLQA